MLPKIGEEYWGVESANPFDFAAVTIAVPPACWTLTKLMSSEAEDVCDAAIWISAIHKEQVAVSDPVR